MEEEVLGMEERRRESREWKRREQGGQTERRDPANVILGKESRKGRG